MHVLDANEIFGMTFYTANKIMEVGGRRGPDALALYVKLLAQTRIQETNQTFTLNKFLEDYFGRGHERLAKTKNVLKELGLVDDVVIRGEDGKLKGHYVRVNFLIDEEKIRTSGITYNFTDSLENRQSVSTTCGEMATNALSNKHINAGSNKLKNMSDFGNNTLTTSCRKRKLTPEQEEKFERVWKVYPQKSGKQEAKGHFVNCDYDELLFDANMKKRKVILGITEKRFILGGQRRMRDFTPQEESMKHVEMKEIFEKHMQMGGDKRERMLALEADFPTVDFNQLYKEWSDKNSILNKISFK